MNYNLKSPPTQAKGPIRFIHNSKTLHPRLNVGFSSTARCAFQWIGLNDSRTTLGVTPSKPMGEAGLDELTLDAICGHAAKTKGQDYTKVTLKKRMEAIAAFPQYKITDMTRSAPYHSNQRDQRRGGGVKQAPLGRLCQTD
jgi:hypothetical protein